MFEEWPDPDWQCTILSGKLPHCIDKGVLSSQAAVLHPFDHVRQRIWRVKEVSQRTTHVATLERNLRSIIVLLNLPLLRTPRVPTN